MKRVFFIFPFIFILGFIMASTTFAKSFSIDQVNIRAWIQPNGNLVVNEIFTYTFDGKYSQVHRSIQKDHHDGVQDFEAYELLNPKAKLGYMQRNELRQLHVSEDDRTYTASLPSNNEKKYIFYIYTLKNAVKSYDSYSDLTVPFFGTDSNHDNDLFHVNIDFYFPQEVDNQNTYAFFHDRKGKVSSKDPYSVHFSTPVSEMYALTETRILFPSSIMSEQAKNAAPMSLKEAVAQEKKRVETAIKKTKQKEGFSKFLIGFLVLLICCCFVLLIMKLVPRRSTESILKHDPLHLYMIHRIGRLNPYAFLSGLYSLVEKGAATVQIQQTRGRFQKDPTAPKHSLLFTLTAPLGKLSSSEKLLVSWLFKQKYGQGKLSFSMTDIAGLTKREKMNQQQAQKYQRRHMEFKRKEKEWFAEVLQELKEERFLNNRFALLTRGLLLIIFTTVLYCYVIDSLSTIAIIGYSVVGGVTLIAGWIQYRRKKRIILFILTSVIGSLMLVDINLMKLLFFSILFVFLLYVLAPRFAFSQKATSIHSEIRQFRKEIKRDGIPTNLTESELEKTITRILLLQVKHSKTKIASLVIPELEYAQALPLTYLIYHDEDPVSYLGNTWKWSNSSASKGSSSGNSYGDSGGGDGGGDGGGGGAD
ncbi:DUF2207 domain-containing protein [Peribacillus sp. NPDC096379]|uniref:DUF2207 domain-containing protein n=1 Tax=Peribacillus sp. NPDC096379 TaxID=3364393 RepID=UPI003804B274